MKKNKSFSHKEQSIVSKPYISECLLKAPAYTLVNYLKKRNIFKRNHFTTL